MTYDWKYLYIVNPKKDATVNDQFRNVLYAKIGNNSLIYSAKMDLVDASKCQGGLNLDAFIGLKSVREPVTEGSKISYVR